MSNEAGADRPTTISFLCAKCGQKLTASTQRVGQRGSCPKCKSPIEVPTNPAAKERPVGAAAENASSSPPRAPASPPALPEVPVRRAANAKEGQEEAPPVASTPDPAPPQVSNFGAEPTGATPPAENSAELASIPEWMRGATRDESPFIYVDESTPEGVRAEPPIVDSSLVAVPRYVVFAQGIALGVVALVAFALGMLAGGSGTGGAADGRGAPGAADVRGTIEYRTSGGTTFPDGGAVVIVFPQEVRPEAEERVAAAGLRPADPPMGPASELRLKQMGALWTRTDPQGTLRATVPRGGKYFVLVISHHGVRGKNREPARADLAAMGRYVDAPDELLGDRRYRWRLVDLRGDVDLSVVLD